MDLESDRNYFQRRGMNVILCDTIEEEDWLKGTLCPAGSWQCQIMLSQGVCHLHGVPVDGLHFRLCPSTTTNCLEDCQLLGALLRPSQQCGLSTMECEFICLSGHMSRVYKCETQPKLYIPPRAISGHTIPGSIAWKFCASVLIPLLLYWCVWGTE